MSDKRIIIGQNTWALPDGDLAFLPKQIESALQEGTGLRIQVLDAAGRRVDLFINWRLVETVVLDLNLDPRPSEPSGFQQDSDPDSTAE